jgi:hypothetical protein
MPFRAPGIAFSARGISFQVGVRIDQYEKVRYQKIALVKALLIQMMQNIYILMVSYEINDATDIVDSARTYL